MKQVKGVLYQCTILSTFTCEIFQNKKLRKAATRKLKSKVITGYHVL